MGTSEVYDVPRFVPLAGKITTRLTRKPYQRGMVPSRNWRIYQDRCDGVFLHDLADKHGLTRERVRQIIAKVHKTVLVAADGGPPIEVLNGH